MPSVAAQAWTPLGLQNSNHLRATVSLRPSRQTQSKTLLPSPRQQRSRNCPEGESEGIAFDPVSRRFFAGTGNGELLAINEAGKVSTFASGGGLRQILGIKVDPDRRLLWVVNGRYPEPDAPADAGTGGIRAYNLRDGCDRHNRRGRRTADPARVQRPCAGDGRHGLCDRHQTNSVYRLAPGGKALELLLQDSRMTLSQRHRPHPRPANALRRPRRRDQRRRCETDSEAVARAGRRFGEQHRRTAATQGASLRPCKIRPIWIGSWELRCRPTGIDRAGLDGELAHAGRYHQTTAAIAGDHLYMIGGNPLPDVYGGTNPAKPDSGIWRVPL